MRIEAILWDYGNVLVNWSPREFYSRVFTSKDRLEFFLENVCPMSWHHLHDMGQSMFETIPLRQKQFPEYAKEIAMWYDNFKDMLFGEIDQSVKTLKKIKAIGIPQYMITNMPKEVKGVCFEGFDFLDSFEKIIVSGEEKLAKPDKAVFELCLRQMGNIFPQNVLFIDDSVVNIDVAAQLGFNTHLFNQDSDLLSVFIELGIFNENK